MESLFSLSRALAGKEFISWGNRWGAPQGAQGREERGAITICKPKLANLSPSHIHATLMKLGILPALRGDQRPIQQGDANQLCPLTRGPTYKLWLQELSMETHVVITALGEAELELLWGQGHLQIHSEFKGSMNYWVRPYLKKVKNLLPSTQKTILKYNVFTLMSHTFRKKCLRMYLTHATNGVKYKYQIQN